MTTTTPHTPEPDPTLNPLPDAQAPRPSRVTKTWRVAAALFLVASVASLVTADVRYLLAGVSTASALACLAAGEILSRSTELLDALTARAEADARLHDVLVAGFDRLAQAIETGAARPSAPPVESKAERLAEVRQAIRNAAWGDAVGLVREFRVSFPDDPRADEALAAVRESAVIETLAKLAASRAANDPDRVIELRDTIKPLLEPEPLRNLDRDLAKWMMGLIQRRLRTGKVTADVPILAAKVATSLDETPEGASLRASLPTLRRAAGLCSRCAQPFTGVEDACPQCLPGQVTTPVEAN